MKKQIKKLSLNKKTISNLSSSELSKMVGGVARSYLGGSRCAHCGTGGGGNSKNCTQNQNTCPGHNTCYTC